MGWVMRAAMNWKLEKNNSLQTRPASKKSSIDKEFPGALASQTFEISGPLKSIYISDARHMEGPEGFHLYTCTSSPPRSVRAVGRGGKRCGLLLFIRRNSHRMYVF